MSHKLTFMPRTESLHSRLIKTPMLKSRVLRKAKRNREMKKDKFAQGDLICHECCLPGKSGVTWAVHKEQQCALFETKKSAAAKKCLQLINKAFGALCKEVLTEEDAKQVEEKKLNFSEVVGDWTAEEKSPEKRVAAVASALLGEILDTLDIQERDHLNPENDDLMNDASDEPEFGDSGGEEPVVPVGNYALKNCID